MTFEIGNYQRGYKWGKKEILELLNDINDYKSDSGLYCLQPLILKPTTHEPKKMQIDGETLEIFPKNEVIDGQQRTTTLFLLLSYLEFINVIDSSWKYEIDFSTRTRSGAFLKTKLPELFTFNIDALQDSDVTERDYSDLTRVNELWSAFITAHKEYDTVDVYHFFVVSLFVRKWCEVVLTDKADFKNKLLENVKVIWYSLDSAMNNDKVIEVFLNNNKGKIKLTSSELIKALFILDIKRKEVQELADLKISQFALEWDAIEKSLQQNSFWYFIQPNENLYKEGTRIDYLFDLHLNKHKKQDDLFAYRFYEKNYNQNTEQLSSFADEWEKIVQLHNKIVDWFKNPELYHYIGYLTNAHIKNLYEIIKELKNKNKDDSKIQLKTLIVEAFKKEAEDDNKKVYQIYKLENLHFEKHKPETQRVLLLHNVLYYINNISENKFPFELYVNMKWSIEHIIPQNPKEITDFELYKNWFEEQMKFQYEGDGVEEIEVVNALKSKTSFEELKADADLSEKINELITSFANRTHQINNLLLLDRNTNSALQNDPFELKRKKILRFDRNGQTDSGIRVFIPVETLNAFNKTFNDHISYTHWTNKDGEAYKEGIEERLKEFLPN
ncbi:DUF262 domain-containing protein [Epilithonimonas sp. JDS]|uniref:DUF262 domain-containing protein n=1 Tax=Epilithonimonas sp. JDS TaxID=2902797 RepID=UPI001E5CEBE8|nr:DUF262 domain-containing protein [Epilithonimonas sp. JDS]MCD9854516.1 DUF262 domain-containing protein [Epilithonimonas sp. JDS]